MRAPHLALLSSPRRRHRVLAALALLVAVAVVVVLVLQAGSPASPSRADAANTASGATTVQRRNLVQTDTESGTLSYSNPQTVYDRLSGTVTWLPRVGQVIKPGSALFDVNGKPVLLMDGTTPAYRDLAPSDSDGADVLELNRNLVRLGFNAGGIVQDDVWQAATTEGIDLLQESLGETETGKLTLGQVVFLPGDQLVSTVDGTVGATSGGGGSGGSPSSSTSDALGPPRPQFVSLTTSKPSTTTTSPHSSASSTTSSSTTTPSSGHTPSTSGHSPGKGTPSSGSSGSGNNSTSQTLAGLEALLREEAAQLKAQQQELRASQQHTPSSSGHNPSSNSHNSSSNSHNSSSNSHNSSSNNHNSPNPSDGSGGANASEILQTTSTKLVVTVDLAASSQSEAVVGEHVTVELPAGNTVRGKITAVSSVAQSSSNGNGNNGSNGSGNNGNSGNGGSSSTIPVTITLSGHHNGAGLDQAAVSVNFVEQKANHVLSVPVTALLATGGGNYAVQEAAAPHTLIPVTTGLFAAGYVQISGAGIHPGLRVTDSQG